MADGVLMHFLKRESRIHNDIDLFVELKHYHDYIYVIKQHGFEEVNTDYTTDGHTVWKDDKQRIIDLHCFEFTDDGIVYEGDIFPSKNFFRYWKSWRYNCFLY